MKTQVSRWGNSLAIRIPKPVADAARLKAGDDLELDVERPGTVKLQKPEKKLTLTDLVEAISEENIHGETEWSESRGNEAW